MRKWLVLFFGACLQCACARHVSVDVNVVDDLGNPVSNATVIVQTQDTYMLGTDARPRDYAWYTNTTDNTGVAHVSFRCHTAIFSCYVMSDNHYLEKNLRGCFLARPNKFLGMTILNPHTNMNFVVARKINPIPMYTYSEKDVKIPLTGENWGFDLQVGDWVEPYGKGTAADFRFNYRWEELEEVLDLTGAMIFSDPGSGAYRLKKGSVTAMQSVYKANESWPFKQRIEYYDRPDFLSPGKRAIKELLEDDEYLVLRTRVKRDAQGQIISANYSKIYGPIRFKRGWIRFKQTSFNPTPNDTNLEYDTSRNLTRRGKGLGSP